MNILFWGVAEWIVAFIVHIIVTRIEKKHYSKLKMLVIYTVVITIFFAIDGFSHFTYPYVFPELIIDKIFLAVFYFSMFIGYITVIFQQVEGDSPTLFMIRLIGNNKNGIEYNKVCETVLNLPFFDSRLDELKNDKAVYSDNGNYLIHRKGLYYMLFQLIASFRKNILKIDTIGG